MPRHALLLLAFFSLLQDPGSQARGDDPFAYVSTPPQECQYLPLGTVRPAGWLREQMVRDMAGFVGHLDELAPDLLVEDDIYGTQRLTRDVKSKSVGNISTGEAWEVQFLWWNSETQSNWRDGFIRHAILLRSPEGLRKVERYVDRILATQDSDGYLGIYDRDLRYTFSGENGELWAKATLLRGLLACAEAGVGGRERVYGAIERCVHDVMRNYPLATSSPFHSSSPVTGGLTHGLAFTDILDYLYRRTGERKYADYALFLYRDYSNNGAGEPDARFQSIMDPSYRMRGHGVHTYEFLRSLTMAYFASGNPRLKTALDRYARRIGELTCPSGGPVGDEYIGGRAADATLTGYEYCSLQELLDAYTGLYQKTGDAAWAEKAERLFLNAAQGARHPRESSIAYLKTDNSYEMTGTRNGAADPAERQTRYKYSPVHQDVAVCCVPNAGRITPTYVRSLWMRDRDGLVAPLYGPCELETHVRGAGIRILEETRYPEEATVMFRVSVSGPVRFALKLRRPAWARGCSVSTAYAERDGHIIIEKTWCDGDSLLVAFVPEVTVNRAGANEVYFTWGPLVLAHPLDAEEIVVKQYALEGFRDLHYRPRQRVVYRYTGSAVSGQGGVFETMMVNASTGTTEIVRVVPMAQTILRQVTFEAGAQ